MVNTVLDCSLNGKVIRLDKLNLLSCDEIASIVGLQVPGYEIENADSYVWSFNMVSLKDLVDCNEDGEEPEGGWKKVYLDHKKSDEEAIKSGGLEYKGRQKWLKEWSGNTSIYPLFLVKEDDNYRILDGYHRLAGAFWNEISEVAAFVGTPKYTYDIKM